MGTPADGMKCSGCCDGTGGACFQCFTASFTRADLIVLEDNVNTVLPLSPLVTIPRGTFKVGQSFDAHTLIKFEGAGVLERFGLSFIVDGDTVNQWVVQSENYSSTVFNAWHIGCGGQFRETDAVTPPNLILDFYSSGTAANGGAENEGFASLGHPRLLNITLADTLQVGTNAIIPDISLDPTIPHTFQWYGQWSAGNHGYTAFAFHHKFWVVG